MCGQEAFNFGTHYDGMKEAKAEMKNGGYFQDRGIRGGGW